MLTKEIIRQVRRIEIKTRKMVDEHLAGRYHSAFKGQGMEFAEVRAYQPGDDIRTIDWNVTARTGAPYVKRFTEERELTVMVIADMSGSLEFGSGRKSKRDLVAELTALFALSAIRNQDKVGCLLFTSKVELFIPPKKGQKHVLRLIREILAFEPGGVGTDIGQALRYFSKVMRRKAVVFLISDFMDRGFAKPLSYVASRHDLIALPIADPRETNPPASGLFVLEDGETGQEHYVDFSSARVRRSFRQKAAAHQERLKETFRKAKADHVPITCGEPYEAALMNFFRVRELRR